MGMTEETTEQKLKRYEDALSACMVEIERLRAENARLRSESDGAHDILRRIYLDEATPSSVRVKAAQAALNVEKPRLQPVPPPLELTAEPIIPLADLVAKRRKRQEALENLPLDDPRRGEWNDNGGNGNSDESGSD